MKTTFLVRCLADRNFGDGTGHYLHPTALPKIDGGYAIPPRRWDWVPRDRAHHFSSRSKLWRTVETIFRDDLPLYNLVVVAVRSKRKGS